MSGGMGPRSSFLSGQGIQTSPFSLSSSSDSGNPIMGGFIVGVAPTSHRESIRIMFKKHHYDEWEFTGIDLGIFGIAVGMTGFGQPNQGPAQVTGGAPGTTNPPSPAPPAFPASPSTQGTPTN